MEDLGVVVMASVVGVLGAEMDPLPLDEVATYWNAYFDGITYYLNEPPLSFSSTPHHVIIDLETMEVVGKGNSSALTPDLIVDLLEAAAAD